MAEISLSLRKLSWRIERSVTHSLVMVAIFFMLSRAQRCATSLFVFIFLANSSLVIGGAFFAISNPCFSHFGRQSGHCIQSMQRFSIVNDRSLSERVMFFFLARLTACFQWG